MQALLSNASIAIVYPLVVRRLLTRRMATKLKNHGKLPLRNSASHLADTSDSAKYDARISCPLHAIDAGCHNS